MSQSRKKSAMEAITNTVTGIAINQLVLYFAGVPLHSAIGMTLVMLILSTARSYVIRRIFV
jgi:hypothetical protein